MLVKIPKMPPPSSIPYEEPIDMWIDGWARNLGLVAPSFAYGVYVAKNLPDSDPNKAELKRYVDRARLAVEANNLDALEGWVNALAVAVKAVVLFIPKTCGKVKSETALTPDVKRSGTNVLQAAATTRMKTLVAAITVYREKFHDGGFRGCLAWLKCQPAYHKDGKICGYRSGMNGKESTAERHIRKILKDLGKGSTA